MSSQSFRFDQHFSQSRLRAAFAPRKSRNLLLRFLLGAVGLGLLVVLVIFGAVVGASMLAVGLVYKLVRGRGTPVAGGHTRDPRVVEGEYRVVEKSILPR